MFVSGKYFAGNALAFRGICCAGALPFLNEVNNEYL
jgi:hypothetical protein